MLFDDWSFRFSVFYAGWRGGRRCNDVAMDDKIEVTVQKTATIFGSRSSALSITMNLSLYSVGAFVILDTDGHRVLAKYYRPKNHPQGEPKGLVTLKEQRAFEKGLWQKTKKAGTYFLFSVRC